MTEPEPEPRFSSRFLLLVSVLGIAVGTGNVWRFPRIVAHNGGAAGAGAFLLAWLVCLATWSLPLLVAEYAIGKATRAGPVLALARLAGPRWGIAGAFVACVATAITFYYCVIAGWCLYYVGLAVGSGLPLTPEASRGAWDSLQTSHAPLVLHGVVMVLAAAVVLRGVRSIERLAGVLVPVLVAVLVACAVRAATLPGAAAGLAYLFTPEWSTLAQPRPWLEALTQNAWDTGAGWGLVLCYAAYMRAGDPVVRSALTTGIGNNLMSLVAAALVFSTVFAVLGGSGSSYQEVLALMRDSGPASTGLTFLWLPQLFVRMPGGHAFAAAFFVALFFAAFTSLVSMVELTTRIFVDAGASRRRALPVVGLVALVLGTPSARSLDFLGNQDFVWGLGLLVSGLLLALAVRRHGAARLRREILESAPGDLRLGRSFDLLMCWGVPIQAVVLLGWWFYLAATQYAPDAAWDPLAAYSPATCLVQWGAALGLCWFAAPRLVAGGAGTPRVRPQSPEAP